VDGARPQTVINEEVRRMFGVDDAWLARARDQAIAEIERRRALYMQRRAPIDAHGRTAVIVDDGLATGATMRIAVRALKAQQPQRLVVAVPVAHPAAVEAVRGEGAEVVCLHTPDVFPGVGAFYADFHQLDDREVIDLLDRTAARTEGAAP
jgi:predicted phosphoribosyltransferase